MNSVSFSGIFPGGGGRFQRCLSLVHQPVKSPLIPLHIMRATKLEMASRDAVFGLRSEYRENTTQDFGRICVGFVGLRLQSFCFLLLKRVQGDYFRLGEFSATGGGGCQLPFSEEQGDKGSIEMLRCLSLSHRKTSWAQSQGRGGRGVGAQSVALAGGGQLFLDHQIPRPRTWVLMVKLRPQLNTGTVVAQVHTETPAHCYLHSLMVLGFLPEPHTPWSHKRDSSKPRVLMYQHSSRIGSCSFQNHLHPAEPLASSHHPWDTNL